MIDLFDALERNDEEAKLENPITQKQAFFQNKIGAGAWRQIGRLAIYFALIGKSKPQQENQTDE